MTDEEGYAEQWPRTGMRLLCWFGRHDWYHLDHFPDGDSFPPGYIARRCKRCGKVQWNTLPAVILPSPGWVNGWPRRANQAALDKMLDGVVKGVSARGLTAPPIEPGLTPEEKGTL